MSVPLKAQTGLFGQLPINRWLERTTPSARAKVASRNFLGRAATPPLPRSIQSCPAGQLHNRKEVGGTKTKDLSAQFLKRGICPPNSKVAHYRLLKFLAALNATDRLRSTTLHPHTQSRCMKCCPGHRVFDLRRSVFERSLRRRRRNRQSG